MVKTAVIASLDTYSEASYLKQIIDGGKVVKVDPHKANAQVFRIVGIDELEKDAARVALAAAQSGTNPKATFIAKALQPGIDYMSANRPGFHVVRIKSRMPQQEPYDFIRNDIICYYEPNGDGPHTIEAIYCHFRWSDEVVIKARDFFNQFMHGDRCAAMALAARTKLAVRLAKAGEPPTIVQGKRKKGDDEDSSSSESSSEESSSESESEEKPLKVPKRVGGTGVAKPTKKKPRRVQRKGRVLWGNIYLFMDNVGQQQLDLRILKRRVHLHKHRIWL